VRFECKIEAVKTHNLFWRGYSRNSRVEHTTRGLHKRATRPATINSPEVA